MEKINILGINLTKISNSEALETIRGYLRGKKKNFIVTPNPEIILAAQNDEEFSYILNQADLSVADGTGLKFAALAQGYNLKRITGADLLRDILRISKEEKAKVAVLNWERALSKNAEIKETISRLYPGLEVEIITVSREELKKPVLTGADIVITNLGAPYQEKFIYYQMDNWPNVKLAIGIGGAFDFLTGRIKRAPAILRSIGLEWFWRLVLEPRLRIKRIYKALLIFPYRFLVWAFINPFRYRENVVCLAYKDSGEGKKIIIVERSGESGHWQLPQGGTDGLSLEEAGKKELKEELGAKGFRCVKTYKDLYWYQFGKRQGEKTDQALMSQKNRGFRGQKQSLAVFEFTGKDEEIIVNYWDHCAYKWVAPGALISEVHPVRKEATKIFLEKFKEAVK